MLPLHRGDRAMHRAGADLGAALQFVRDRLQESIAPRGVERVRGVHDRAELVVLPVASAVAGRMLGVLIAIPSGMTSHPLRPGAFFKVG